jgi:hypothetical protein
MRRILNLNQTGVIIIKVIGLFIFVIPVFLYGASLLLGFVNIHTILFLGAIKLSVVIGAYALAILLILVVVEQIQDYSFDRRYQKNRDRKVQLADGNYECQFCGNQKVKEDDKTCQVCGRELK